MRHGIRRAATGLVVGLALIQGGLVVTAAAAAPPESRVRAVEAVRPTAPLAAALDPLPIVVTGLPSADDRRAASAWGAATVLRPEPLVDLFAASWDAMTVEPGGQPAVDDLRRRVGAEPEPVASEEFHRAATDAMQALAADPANADRLSNAAVAAWLVGVTADLDPGSELRASGYAQYIQQAAIRLLDETNRTFLGRRAVLLNLAFLTTTVPGWGFDGARYAREALAIDPDDVTARALLASIESRRADTPHGVDRALAALRPLRDDPRHAALGEALAGDAHLAAASIRRTEAPAGARHAAGLALAAYDRAIALADEAGLHAGRARALELRGDLPAAASAAARAVELAPGSLDLLVEVARLRELAGDVEGMREAATAAISLVAGTWDPPVNGLRFVTGPGGYRVVGDRGFLGWSLGSDRDHLPVTQTPQGGGLVAVGVIPRVDGGGEIDHRLASEPGPYAAWSLAFEAAALGADPADAAAIAAEWNRSLPWAATWDGWLDAATVTAAGTARPAAGGPEAEQPIGLHVAQTALRRTGRFADAAALCLAHGDLRCAGSSAFHAGDPASARGHFDAAYEASTTALGADPELRLLAAVAAEAAGETGLAGERFAEAAADDDSDALGNEPARLRLIAALRSGDLRLAADDPGGAIAWYDLALATIEANGLGEIAEYHQDATSALEIRGLGQAAHNNRAVALLRSRQPGPDQPPDCSGTTGEARCGLALRDLRAASASDPDNAVYRMNAGWAERLLGDGAAAREALEAAVALDPTLYPAFNDLGILLAREGDPAGARRAFEAATEAAPDYDLARWNLGILALRDGPAGLAEGQARLAEAIRLDPDLRTAPLDFRTDERTYRFGFEAPLPAAAGTAPGQAFSVGAAALATASAVAGIVQLQAAVFGHAVATASGRVQEWLDRQAREARWRSRRRSLRRSVPAAARRWLPWLLAGAVLGIVTAWQASQASPATAVAAVLLGLLAALVAVVAHELGHLVAARFLGGRMMPAAWLPGAAAALLFVPFQVATGPFLAERVRLSAGGGSAAWRFHLAGPAANALVGTAAYGLFLLEPMPVLRLVAQVQLAAIAYALLPVRPLDGWVLQRERPRLLVALGFGVVAASAAFALGLL